MSGNGETDKARREAELAAALRANLRRRKAAPTPPASETSGTRQGETSRDK